MDGAELLLAVRERFPEVIRIAACRKTCCLPPPGRPTPIVSAWSSKCGKVQQSMLDKLLASALDYRNGNLDYVYEETLERYLSGILPPLPKRLPKNIF
jgi:hypothetical protein